MDTSHTNLTKPPQRHPADTEAVLPYALRGLKPVSIPVIGVGIVRRHLSLLPPIS